jgi:hypothetical protein
VYDLTVISQLFYIVHTRLLVLLWICLFFLFVLIFFLFVILFLFFVFVFVFGYLSFVTEWHNGVIKDDINLSGVHTIACCVVGLFPSQLRLAITILLKMTISAHLVCWNATTFVGFCFNIIVWIFSKLE